MGKNNKHNKTAVVAKPIVADKSKDIKKDGKVSPQKLQAKKVEEVKVGAENGHAAPVHTPKNMWDFFAEDEKYRK